MWNKINIMLPTYNRSDSKLPQFINSAIDTCASTKNICFTFVCNQNDQPSVTFIKARLTNIADFAILTENLSAPHLAKYFNMAYTQTPFNQENVCVSMFGDDFIFRTERWDEIFLEWINAYNGIGIFYGDDCSRFGKELATMFVTTRKYVNAMQPQQHPFMSELFPIDEIDVIHHKIAQQLDRLFYLRHVKIFHNHATLHGNMDAVWERMRKQINESRRNKHLIDDIVKNAVANLNKNLKDEFQPPIKVIMTTYGRTELVRRTVASYNNSSPLPTRIDVYDDGSGDDVKDAILGMKGAVWHQSDRHLGAPAKTPDALREQFLDPTTNAVIIIDSDTQFHTTWFARACALYNQIKDRPDIPVVSLYNENSGIVCRDNQIPSVVRKLGIGAFGMIVTRKFWDTYISTYPTWGKSKSWDWWDIQTSQKALNDGNLVGASSPSVLQHTGIYSGTHGSTANTSCAEDFLEDQDAAKDIQIAINAGADSNKVLVSLQGRYGDCILGSLVVNMIIEMGFRVDWITIPNYKDLVALTCPNARIIINGIMPDSYFLHTDTQTMREMYPGYRYYINLQPGAPENHGRLLASGKNMALFVKELAENVLSVKLPDDFTKYRRLAIEQEPDMRWYSGARPLAIIAPEVISIPNAMTPQWMEQTFAELSQHYCTRILTKNPPNLPISAIRDKYIYKYTFEQCIFLLRHASLLYVNDSGLAWAAIYSDKCRKKVIHRRKRLSETNMRYRELDESYEDITID